MKVFDGIHSGKLFREASNKLSTSNRIINQQLLGGIMCVRWSATGDMLASVSGDKAAKAIDFKAGKIIYSGTSPDSTDFFKKTSYAYIFHYRPPDVSLLYLIRPVSYMRKDIN